MTPEQKAKELVEEYKSIIGEFNDELNLELAKQCALIAVDEIKSMPYHKWMSEKEANEFCDYLISVKTAITKL